MEEMFVWVPRIGDGTMAVPFRAKYVDETAVKRAEQIAEDGDRLLWRMEGHKRTLNYIKAQRDTTVVSEDIARALQEA